MSAAKTVTPRDCASACASLVIGTSNAKMHEYFFNFFSFMMFARIMSFLCTGPMLRPLTGIFTCTVTPSGGCWRMDHKLSVDYEAIEYVLHLSSGTPTKPLVIREWMLEHRRPQAPFYQKYLSCPPSRGLLARLPCHPFRPQRVVFLPLHFQDWGQIS